MFFTEIMVAMNDKDNLHFKKRKKIKNMDLFTL